MPFQSVCFLFFLLDILGSDPVQGHSPMQAIFKVTDDSLTADQQSTFTTVTDNALNVNSGTDLSFPSSQPSLMPPRNLTLLASGLDPDGRAYLQISWLPPVVSFSHVDHSPLSAIDRYRITWRDHLNSKEEFRKTINGDLTSYTIEHLLTNVQIFIEVQAFRWIDDRKLRSPRTSLTVRTPSRRTDYETQGDMPRLTSDKTQIMVFEYNLTVNNVFFQNGLLKANVSWSSVASPTATLTGSNSLFIVRWYPKVCLGSERKSPKEHVLIKPLVATTIASSVILYDLSFNCRYAVAVYQKTDADSTRSMEKLRGVKHFITPMCQDVAVVGNVLPNCPSLPPRVPTAPQNLSCMFLVQQSEISATCTWESPEISDQPVVAYRAIYARKLLDPHGLYGVHPFPVLDRNSYVMKVLDEDEMSFSLASLAEETEYTVHIQAVSAAGFGAMSRLEFVTPKIVHSVALSQAGPNKRAPPDYTSGTLKQNTRICFSTVLIAVIVCSSWSFRLLMLS